MLSRVFGSIVVPFLAGAGFTLIAISWLKELVRP